MSDNSRLRIALQKSGRLSEDSLSLLEQAGLRVRVRAQRLIAIAENFPVEVLLVRDDDIPGLVMDGTVDMGIVGEGVLEEMKLAREASGNEASCTVKRRLDFRQSVQPGFRISGKQGSHRYHESRLSEQQPTAGHQRDRVVPARHCCYSHGRLLPW